MTRQLVRLADLAYRRRGRMVLAWLAAAVVIIGVGSALAGEYNANYDTPGSESKAASDLTQERFAGYSGQEIYVVWKDPAGVDNAAAKQRIGAFIADARKGRPHRAGDADPDLRERPDRSHHAAAHGRRLGRPEGGRREADRRGRAPHRRRLGDQARR
jgi:RND superfamily putative drug exporter